MNRISGKRKLLFVILEMCLIVLITGILTEAAFRVYNVMNPSFIFPSQSYNRFRGKPFSHDYSSFRLNSKGFKDIEFSPEKKPDTLRIIAIGDSFTFGVVPYEYTYLTLLEDRLNSGDKDFEVINMGIPSIGAKDYLSVLVHEGITLNPDIAVINFFIGNDFTTSRKVSSSYVLSFFRYILKIVPNYEGKIIHGDITYDDNEKSFSDETFVEIEAERSFIYLKEDRDIIKQITGAIFYLKKIQEICDQKKIRLLVVLIPDEIQLNTGLQNKVADYLNTDSASFDFTRPNALLARELSGNHIAFVDLLSHFRNMSDREGLRLYKPNNTHWNIAGNELASEILHQAILDLR